MRPAPELEATRLIASVVPRTKMISRCFAGVEEAPDLGPSPLIRRGRGFAQRVDAAMHVGVVAVS